MLEKKYGETYPAQRLPLANEKQSRIPGRIAGSLSENYAVKGKRVTGGIIVGYRGIMSAGFIWRENGHRDFVVGITSGHD